MEPSSSAAAALAGRRAVYGPNAALSYERPLHIVAGRGTTLEDADGVQYLDCVNNVAHVGHANPRVAAAVAEQMTRVNTNSRYLSAELNEYAAELVATLPEPLQVTYLVNSGSEANDLALRIAAAAAPARRGAAGGSAAAGSTAPVRRDHVVVMAGAYHGHLSSLIPLSPYKFWGPGGSGREHWVHVMPCPDTYRGRNLDGAAAARAVLAQAEAAGGRVSMFICESIISCGGQVVLPPGYLAAVYAVMRDAGVVCVADEVQTGFGRVGDAFWAFQLQGVVPDIVTMGKPIGNGFPLAALVTSRHLADCFASGGMEYFNTTGGCNAAVAAGRAVLREMRQQRLQQHAADVGSYLLGGLRRLQAAHPQVGDVRGAGLFLGVELVVDRASKTPAPAAAAAVKEAAKAARVLLSTDGPAGNVIKIKPPLVFGREQADMLLAALDAALVQLSSEREGVAAAEAREAARLAPVLARYAANETALWALLQRQRGGGASSGSERRAAAAWHEEQQQPVIVAAAALASAGSAARGGCVSVQQQPQQCMGEPPAAKL